jgi:hypothetical protein
MGARTVGLCHRYLWFFELFNENLSTGGRDETPAEVWDRVAAGMRLSPEQVGCACCVR